MARFFITLQYDGSAYHGWQIQPNGNSVQEEMQKALSTLLRETVEVVGAGRTDAGVHASMMVAHFDTGQCIDGDQLAYRLNKILPRDIAVRGIRQVNDDMHARFSALSRTYHYYIHTRKNPFINGYSCLLQYKLDVGKMNEAGRYLTTCHDFAAFCKSHTDVKTTLCDVTEAKWEWIDDNRLMFTITANRFLRNMVRAVVGTMVDVGRGKLSLEDFQKVVGSRKRTSAGESMPAHALFLHDIQYGD